MNRVAFLSGAASLAVAPISLKTPLTKLEARYGGRLGVFAVNSANGARVEHRSGERFPMCSTFKVLLVGAVLSRVDSGGEHLERHVGYGNADLLAYAPVTRAHVRLGSMTVQALCRAAVEYSDNTAANLLLRALGGPDRVTAYARTLGDSLTRLDRNEPGLNTAIPGDQRDTTTPAAMLANLRKLLTGSVLSPSSRRELESWMIGCKTGTDCIRAGVPAHWRVGDKTGSGAHATRNDIAVLYPPGRSPIFVTAYYTASSASEGARADILAEVGRVVSSAFA
ncbi:MAG TPA: class A beta-lactamase [Candidatus Baltobacteraceae bacterium]